MGLFGGGSVPTPQNIAPAPIVVPPQPVVPPAANSPIIANAGSGAGAATRAGTAGPVAGMAGFDGTVATSPMGAPGGSTAVKSLLGG